MSEGSMKRRVDGSQNHLGRCGDEKKRRTGSVPKGCRVASILEILSEIKTEYLNKSALRSPNENFYSRI